MTSLSYPAKPKPRDRVAVVSPSAGLPALLPQVYELGLRRLREEFGLEPRDLTAAFAGPSVTAVLATVGGQDLITVTPHLDDEVLRANPKPYFGYSDNTNVLNHPHRLGIVSYHGGSVLVHLGRSGRSHPLTVDSLRAALFTSGWYDLAPAAEWGDEPNDWNDPASLADEPAMDPGAGWRWQGPGDRLRRRSGPHRPAADHPVRRRRPGGRRSAADFRALLTLRRLGSPPTRAA